jgi:hypothetical protein
LLTEELTNYSELLKRNSDSNMSQPVLSQRFPISENIPWSSLYPAITEFIMPPLLTHFHYLLHLLCHLSILLLIGPLLVVHSLKLTSIWIQLAHNFIQISIKITYQSNLTLPIVPLFKVYPYPSKPYNFENYTKITYTTIILVSK